MKRSTPRGELGVECPGFTPGMGSSRSRFPLAFLPAGEENRAMCAESFIPNVIKASKVFQ
jgi:hypothetical protein